MGLVTDSVTGSVIDPALDLATNLAKIIAKGPGRRTRSFKSQDHASSARAERKEIKRSCRRAIFVSCRRSDGEGDDSNSLSHPLSCAHEINSFYRSIPVCGHSPLLAFMVFFACSVFDRARAANTSSASAVFSILSTPSTLAMLSTFSMLPLLRVDSPRAASRLESTAHLR